MTVFQIDPLWSPGELHYEYFESSGKDTTKVETVIKDINDIYSPKHGGSLLLTPKGSKVVDASKVLRIKHVDSGGGSAGIGKTDRSDEVLTANFNKKTNVLHEIFHVLGFEHENYHKNYSTLLKIIGAYWGDPLGGRADFRTLTLVQKRIQSILRFMPSNKAGAGCTTYTFNDYPVPKPRSGGLKLEKKIISWAGDQLLIAARKKQNASKFYHSPTFDPGTVMLYARHNNDIVKIIDNYNQFLAVATNFNGTDFKAMGIEFFNRIAKYRFVSGISQVAKAYRITANEKQVLQDY